MGADIEEVDVAVIGAGASGLVSAHHLLRDTSLKVLVLEAKDRVGGRLCSVKIPTADGFDEWDMGGQWVSRSQHYVMQLLKDFGTEVYPQYTDGRNKLVVYNLSDIRTYSGLIPKFGIGELLDINNLIQKLEAMIKQIPLENPLECKYLKEWDNQTVETMVEKQSTFKATINLLNAAVRTVFGCESSHLSFFYFLYYAALAGGFNELLDTSPGTAQEYRVKGTMNGCIKKLAAKVGVENVKTGNPVTVIQQCDDSTLLLSTLNGQKYRAKFVICAIPPHLVGKIHFSPPLPFNRQQLNQRMPVGNMMKCLAVYKSAFWRENNLSGSSIVTLERYNEGPICATFDATTSNGTPALLAFIAGEQAFYWSQKTTEERRIAVLNYLVAVFGTEARTELIAYEDKDWAQEDYNGGCPVGLMQPGCFTYFEHALREPFGRIHFAGTETARKWTGYIDGAVEAGLRAAQEVEDRLKSLDVTFPSKISSHSSVFDQPAPSTSKFGSKVARVLLAGVLIGGIGYVGYRKCNFSLCGLCTTE